MKVNWYLKHNFQNIKMLPKTKQNCEYLFEDLTVYFAVSFIFDILKNFKRDERNLVRMQSKI